MESFCVHVGIGSRIIIYYINNCLIILMDPKYIFLEIQLFHLKVVAVLRLRFQLTCLIFCFCSICNINTQAKKKSFHLTLKGFLCASAGRALTTGLL